MQMTKKRIAYFADHEKTVLADVNMSVSAGDFEDVAQQFKDYGRFLVRHPEALEALSGR